MDKDHAESIAMSKILDKLQIKPNHIGKSKALYRSPICKEQEPSFWVYFKNNTWYDYAIPAGGDLNDFARLYLRFTGEAHTPVDVSRWVTNMSDKNRSFPSENEGDGTNGPTDEPVLILKTADQIRFMGLIRYLEDLGISASLARRYVKEVKVFNRKTGRTFIAIGVANENGGYELHNPLFNGFIQPRSITFFRGTASPSRGVHVFNDIFDFLSVLSYLGHEKWEHDTILLHSPSNAQMAAPYVEHYGYKTVHTWMDNDLNGRKATSVLHSFLKNQPGLVYLKMNRVYEEYSSVNAWHIASHVKQKPS